MSREGKRGLPPIAPLSGSNWDGMSGFDSLIKSLPQTPEPSALLNDYKVHQLGSSNDWTYNGSDNDIVMVAWLAKNMAANVNEWRGRRE